MIEARVTCKDCGRLMKSQEITFGQSQYVTLSLTNLLGHNAYTEEPELVDVCPRCRRERKNG